MDLLSARQMLEPRGQLHVLGFWERLRPGERQALLEDLAGLSWPLLDRLIAGPPPSRDEVDPQSVEAARAIAAGDPALQAAAGRGRALLREGRVAALTVAGGQGTRLKFDGPKGLFPITPVRGKTLFAHFAESLLAAGRRYGSPPPWYVMTSPENHADTRAFFEQHGFFGLAAGQVTFFPQGTMPAFSDHGKLLLAERHRLALTPDGHGGLVRALGRGGVLDDIRSRNVRYLSCFQVDNPLVQPLDPVFLGLMDLEGSEAGSKAVRKAGDLEPVGVFARIAGRTRVIEYSDLPEALARRRNPDGSRFLDLANIAVHVFDVDFLRRLLSGEPDAEFGWHFARKVVPYIDPDTGHRVRPAAPNAVKCEKFIFDLLPLARNPLILEVARPDEFSPVKNAAGQDSPQTARRDLIARWVRWLADCGLAVPEGRAVEISPLFALDAGELDARLRAGAAPDTSGPLYLGP